ncbi:MAG TPA: farnesyl diphosphate synthase [Steroidobacteraceae bacterium]|nr:farnesyl diphosphate synthase [Steroidobacteraceae bacterium]
MAAEAAAALPWQSQYSSRVEGVLERHLPGADTDPARLHAAMRYAALGPGKRIRPVLVYATGEAVGLAPAVLDAPAAAVELIHAYSLVHDDLPAMDDDDLRRGRPTTHRAFDEATAILAGDALQVLAFEILAGDTALPVDPARRLEMIRVLAHASGTQGMAGGQAMDLAAVGQRLARDQVEEMHARKTGALIRAAVTITCLAAPSLPAQMRKGLEHYGAAVGLSFQIVDDLLDVLGDPALTGKGAGSDALRGKPTYPSVAGIAAARQRAAELAGEGIEAIRAFGPEALHLREFATELVARSH